MIAKLIVGLLLAPIVIIFFHVRAILIPADLEFIQLLLRNVLQAGISAIATLLLAVVGALGLCAVSNTRLRRVFEVIIMLPSLMPTIFIIIAVLNLITRYMHFPFGIWGVIIIHVVINVGAVSVVMAKFIDQQAAGMIELALVEGATFWQIFMSLVRELKTKFLYLVAFVFATSFASFSIPLIVGAESGKTVEVLIYQMVVGAGNLGVASALSIVQVIFLFGLSLLIYRSDISFARQSQRNVKWIKWPILNLFLLTLTALVIISNTFGLWAGLTYFFHSSEILNQTIVLTIGSFLESILVGIIIFLFMCGVAYSYVQNKWILIFLNGYSVPSSVITGLAFYLLINTLQVPAFITYLALAMGFTIITLPHIYRYYGRAQIENLSKQIFIARTLGATPAAIFIDIMFPQISRQLYFASAVAAFWASGDFALSSLIASKEMTLAMGVRTYLSGYHLELATALMFVSILVGIFVYYLFEGIGYVSRSKSI